MARQIQEQPSNRIQEDDDTHDSFHIHHRTIVTPLNQSRFDNTCTLYTRSGIEKAVLKDKIKSFYDLDIYEREKIN